VLTFVCPRKLEDARLAFTMSRSCAILLTKCLSPLSRGGGWKVCQQLQALLRRENNTDLRYRLRTQGGKQLTGIPLTRIVTWVQGRQKTGASFHVFADSSSVVIIKLEVSTYVSLSHVPCSSLRLMDHWLPVTGYCYRVVSYKASMHCDHFLICCTSPSEF
jgi:hypothetical protein